MKLPLSGNIFIQSLSIFLVLPYTHARHSSCTTSSRLDFFLLFVIPNLMHHSPNSYTASSAGASVKLPKLWVHVTSPRASTEHNHTEEWAEDVTWVSKAAKMPQLKALVETQLVYCIFHYSSPLSHPLFVSWCEMSALGAVAVQCDSPSS